MSPDALSALALLNEELVQMHEEVFAQLCDFDGQVELMLAAAASPILLRSEAPPGRC